jgi:hypothetical protein
MNKIKAADVKPFWTPKTPPVPKQCATCPFGPNAHLLNDSAGALKSAQDAADMGLDFHCHKTVYKGAFVSAVPTMRPRSVWRTCAGAYEYKRKREVETRKEALRAQGLLIED